MDPVVLKPMTLIAAPTGYGKTILLAEAFRRISATGRTCFWIGIDAHDGAEASLVDAVEQHLGLADALIPDAPDYRRALTSRDRVDAIIRRLARMENYPLFFIDNVDLGIEREARVLLDALLFAPNQLCTLLVSCSTEPPFDATRATLEMRMQRIGTTELAFGATEIVALFRDAGVAELPPDNARRILAQSEGWPAAIRLIQVLAVTSPGGESVEGLPLEGERLSDALFDKLFARLPTELGHFLVEISVFATFSAELLLHATETDKAPKFIRYLLDNDLLIVALDARGEWFRFHKLFKAYLRRRSGGRASTPRLRTVMKRGAQWLERHDGIEPALELAIEAGEQSLAVRLLEKLSWSLVRSRGNLPAFIRWAERLRGRGYTLGVEATFWLAWAFIFDRRYEDAAKSIESLRQKLTAKEESSPRGIKVQAKTGLAEIVLKLHMDDLKGVQRLAPKWLERFSDEEPFQHGAGAGSLALALLADFKFAEARSAARTSLAAVAPTSSIYGRSWATNISAMIAIATCNSERVEQALAALEIEIRTAIDGETLSGAVTSAVRSRALYDRGEVEEAAALAERALPLVQTCGMLDFVWQAIEVLLAARLIGARETPPLAELRQIAEQYPKRLSILLDLGLVRLLCAKGDVAQATELAERVGLWSADGRFSVPGDLTLESERWASATAGIALLTAHGQLKAAGNLIDEQLVLARQSSRRGAAVEMYVAQAALLVRSGQRHQARRVFARALNLAAECKSVRPFYEQRALTAHLIGATSIRELGLASEAARNIVEQVIILIGGESTVQPDGEPESILTPLTPRECELLRMLDAGLDNAQIAASSDISVRTVKWHLHNLYAKLDVKNRTAAVAYARQLQLI